MAMSRVKTRLQGMAVDVLLLRVEIKEASIVKRQVMIVESMVIVILVVMVDYIDYSEINLSGERRFFFSLSSQT